MADAPSDAGTEAPPAAAGGAQPSPEAAAVAPPALANATAAAGAGGEERPPLPPAKSIFNVHKPKVDGGDSSPDGPARIGELLGLPTPTFAQLTSRGMPLHLRPAALSAMLEGQQQLFELPVGDIMLRQDTVGRCPDAAEGCRGFWPHLQGHLTYCSFRDPRKSPSVHGGDSVCSVETSGGRRKVGPRDLLDIQKAMRVDIVAAPGEEVPINVSAARRLNRAVGRAADWLKEILQAKAQEPELDFDWHVLASIQGGGDVKLRQKACHNAASMPVAGAWIGGLGYDESLPSRAKVLEAVTTALPPLLPRFLPLDVGTPLEVLQAVLLGVDVFELTFPMQAATRGMALTFSWEMPADDAGASGTPDGAVDGLDEALLELVPQSPATVEKEKDGPAPAPAPAAAAPPRTARQLQLRSSECREDFGPISPASPVRQYSRAYLHHLFEVRELLGTMLLAQHNLHVYTRFFEAIRSHIRQGTLRRFASWFVRTQTTLEPTPPAQAAPQGGPPPKRRKT